MRAATSHLDRRRPAGAGEQTQREIYDLPTAEGAEPHTVQTLMVPGLADSVERGWHEEVTVPT